MNERRLSSVTPVAVQRLADLQAAIAGGEIDILFQSQVAMDGGAIVGVEALARWPHPELGELGPGKLFEIATRSSTVAALSRHIQDRALSMAACWPKALAGLRLSVNVTSEDIAEDGFAAQTLARLGRTGFPAERLTLEITEAGLIVDLDRAARVLDGLRDQGIRIAIDDFGTGYSSLAYLKALPLDYLKLDHGFSQDIVGSERARTIIRGVIRLARDLGLEVIAEGVETEAQRELLAAAGCAIYQGFLHSAPIASDDLAALIRPPV